MGYSTEVTGHISTDRPVSMADLQQIRDVNWWCEEVMQDDTVLSWDATQNRVYMEKDMQKILDVLQSGSYNITELEMYWFGEDSNDSGYFKLVESEVHMYRAKRKFRFVSTLSYEPPDENTELLDQKSEN